MEKCGMDGGMLQRAREVGNELIYMIFAALGGTDCEELFLTGTFCFS